MLAGYISANRVDLAQVDKYADGVKLYDEDRYISTDYPTLNSIVALYLKRHKMEISTICFGIAGPVIGDEVSPTNLDWHITGSGLKDAFGFKQVTLINDVVATAHGVEHLDHDKFFVLNDGNSEGYRAIGLIAAGSGLGQALIYRNGMTFDSYASEGGHAWFSPGNQLEAELWEYIYAGQGFVEAEDVISWTGFENIYNFLCDTQGGRRSDWFEQARWRASAIIERALSGADETAMRTLDVFIDCLASEAANLALKGMTLGGIYVGGQIVPRIITLLEDGRFMRRFAMTGKMKSLLGGMPVRVIIEDRAALIGAGAIARSVLDIA